MKSKIELTLATLLFPLRSLSFYKKDLFVEIVEGRVKNIDIQKSIIKDIRLELGKNYKFHSIDELKLMLKKFYPFIFNEELTKEEAFSLENIVLFKYIEVINNLSKALIAHRDGKITYKYWKNAVDDTLFGPYDEVHKIQIFNILSRMMPMDILVVNYLLENNMDDVEQLNGFYSSIMLPDMQLEDVLLGGVAENHVHAGASFNFTVAWNIMMNQYRTRDREYIRIFNKLYNTKDNPMKNYILAAALLRSILAIFLKHIDIDNLDEFEGDFDQWIDKYRSCSDIEKTDYEENYNAKRKKVYEFIKNFSEGKDINRWVRENSIIRDGSGDYFKLFEDIWDIVKFENMPNTDDQKEDYIFDIFRWTRHIKTYGENVFIFYCLKYIKSQKEDVLFLSLFINYLRIKNVAFNSITQDGSVLKGLDHFKDYYEKASNSIRMINDKVFWKTFFRTMFQNTYLKKLEVRISKSNYLRKNTFDILSAYKEVIDEDYINLNKTEFPMFGLVVHLIKKEDVVPEEKCWRLYSEEKEFTKKELYFGKLQNEYITSVEELIRFRNEIPHLSEFILGLDAASGENDTPISVFAPVFKIARDSKSQKLQQRDFSDRLIKNKSLAFTFHAGEDFRHLLSGLRRIDEVIKHCKFHAGDRIGHGIALGVDVDYWKNVNPVVILPMGEHLDNLLWVWGIYSSEENYNPKINLYLENQIYKYAKMIYQNMNGINTAMLYEAYLKRFEKFSVNKFYSNGVTAKPTMNDIFCIMLDETHTQVWSADKLNHAHNCKCYLKKIYEPIQVALNEMECQIISEVQEIVRNKLAVKGIVVEVNPTSNLVIGEMNGLFHHQAYIINNIFEANRNNIILNINSDDPTVFNTNVSNEIAYLYYGLLHKKVSREDALIWIDKLREYGLKTSFISSEISHDEYYKYLEEVLEQLGER